MQLNIRQRRLSCFIVLSICAASLFPVRAQAALEELSLTELLNTQISVASKKAESAGEAPATITVITAEKLRSLRITNLVDVFSYVPNTSVMETYWREPIVTVRGVMESLYNDKILLLINGVPAFEAVNGSSYFEQMPIDAIERIEIVRGPGSVLYGTNAFAGVINIVTKTGADQNGLTLDLSGSTIGRVLGTVTYGKKTQDANGVDYLVSGSYARNGYSKVFDYDEAATTFNGQDTYTYDYKNDVNNIFATAGYKGLRVFGSYWTQDQNKFGMVPQLGYGGLAEHKGYNLAIQFTTGITDMLSYTASGRYTWMERYTRVGYSASDQVPGWNQGFISRGDHSLYKGSIYTLDNFVTVSPQANLNVIVGGSYEKDMPQNLYTMFRDGVEQNAGSLQLPVPEPDNWAGYVQAGYSFAKVSVTGGVRYSDLGKDVGSFLSPRIALVYAYTKDNRIKLLYGDAFRNPTVYERYVLVPGVLSGTPALKAEKISTIESSIDYTFGGSVNTKLTVFHSKLTDLITRATISGLPTYVNSTDAQLIDGAEVEVESVLPYNIKLSGNVSYKDAKYETSGVHVPYVERYLANLALIYSPNARFSVSPNIQFVGDREGSLNTATPQPWVSSIPYASITVPSFTLVNFDVNYTASDRFTLYAGVKNLFDVKYAYPEHARRLIDKIPGGPGISLYAGVRYRV